MVSITHLTVVAALPIRTCCSGIQFAGGGVAAGIPAFLRDRQRGVQDVTGQFPQTCHGYVIVCAGAACTNLHTATVTLLSGLQEGISTHRPSVDTIGGGGIQQTGRVDLLQEPAELLLTAAAEQLRVHHARKRQKEMVKN